ncbi:cytochrome c oxidase subunit II [Ureibacillus sp. FSL K6-8385]|uniref:cytochrome c oxidase subunit II n=1 Tax=Ureibacillus sp. FSL K6-8385 TaxID=2954684 RepID=UPI0031583E19
MEIHKYEKWWMIFGTGTLIVFLIILGVSAFHGGTHPNNSKWTINYENVDQIEPFNNPGLHKVEGKDWDYEVVLVAQAFAYNPTEIEIPAGSKVRFIATTKDVIHGFEVAGTNINLMLEPGYVSEKITTLDKPGTYTIVCNEYCGSGHALMYSTLKVVDNNDNN